MPALIRGIKHDDPVAIYRGEKVLSVSKRLGRICTALGNLDFAIDIFYALYLPYPLLLPASDVSGESELSYRILKSIMESEDFQQLRLSTIANSTISTLVSASFIDTLSKELSREGLLLDKEQAETSVSEPSLNAIVKRALRQVAKEAHSIKKLQQLVSFGTQAGMGSVFDLEERGDDIIKLARNTDVQRLLEVLSLFPRIARKVRRKVMPFSRGEFRGYDIGSDLERIVPTELALPKLLFRIKYIESKLLLYEKLIPKDIGPLYVLVDKSGSMEGEKIRWAKATALALLIKARREGRDFFLRFFDGMPHALTCVPRRMRSDEVIDLLKYLSRVKSGGGTDITKAIVTACDDLKGPKVRGVADVILITDGEDNISDLLVTRKLRSANARLVTVMVMGENRSLKNVSDSYLRVTKLNEGDILRVVEA